MREFYFLSMLLFLGSLQLKAQSTLHFTIKQLPALIADAGADKTIKKGEQITLGSATPATGGSGNFTYSWAPSTGLDKTDSANPTATPDSTITYTLTVNDAGGCSQSSKVTVTVDLATGIKNPTTELGLLIFPNPNNGTFFITSEKALAGDIIQLEIFDPIGKILYSEKVDGRKKLNKIIRLAQQTKGVFILRLSNSELNIIQRIIVQ